MDSSREAFRFLPPASMFAGVAAHAKGEAHSHAQSAWEHTITSLGEADAHIAQAFARTPAGAAFLDCLFAGSPFLTGLATAEPALLARFFAEGPEVVEAALVDVLCRQARSESDGARFGVLLRRMRRRHALVMACTELAALWPLERVMRAHSQFAETVLDLTAWHLLHRYAASSRISFADEHKCGYVVLLLGKGGAGELNYSSDIDFMVLYDPTRIASAARGSLQREMNALTAELIALLGEASGEGRVFRCDMRLRPDPGAMPLAISLQVALHYYESRGQNWERCAMIKARAVAGDRELGEVFLRELRPYVWRKYLDFAALQDIHAIKRQIHASTPAPQGDSLYGHNLKLGRGGIREIEFFVQTQQLIWGGRAQSLRTPRTLSALTALAWAGRISPRVMADLQTAYRFLRSLEHRLQMVDDKQTHDLPRTAEEFERFARFYASSTADALLARVSETLSCVAGHYAHLFESETSLAERGNLVFTGSDAEPGTLATLRDLGFYNGAGVFSLIRDWHHGRYRATNPVSARERLTELVPRILECAGSTPNPDETLLRFDRLLARVPAGVQLFALLQHNPRLLESLIETIGLSPLLAQDLAQRPQLLDAMLDGDFHSPPQALDTPVPNELIEAWRESDNFEDSLELLQRRLSDRLFRLGFQVLHGLLPIREGALHATHLAEQCLEAMLPPLLESFAERHGTMQDGDAGFAVLALGRFGARGMGPHSDLDLVFLFDERGGDAAPPAMGARPLKAGEYWGRFARRLQGTLSARLATGEIYEVDPRLRPHGEAGPTALSCAAFAAYYEREDAWLWELMALTRARVVCAKPAFAERLKETIRRILTRPRAPQDVVRAARDMRARIRVEHPARGLLDARYRTGGLYDLDFLAQTMMLIHAPRDDSVLCCDTESAWQALAAAGALGESDASFLAESTRLWEDLRWYLQLTAGAGLRAEDAGATLRRGLSRACGREDFTELLAELDARAARVIELWETLI